MIISTHTLTWSVTGMGFWRSLLKIHFNSHAHVERDEIVRNWINAQSISTHTLTWSVTGIISSSYLLIYAFQLTRSRGAWLQNCNYLLWQYHFNSHAHVERDVSNITWFLISIISTHTLTWSVTQTFRKWWFPAIFQLTRSRGAWREHPLLLCLFIFISTHTLTWSVTYNH